MASPRPSPSLRFWRGGLNGLAKGGLAKVDWRRWIGEGGLAKVDWRQAN